MTPSIFPGLSAKGKLFDTLSAFIADNGGRVRLALVLEAESLKSRRWKPQKAIKKIPKHLQYSKLEIELLLTGVMSLPDRSYSSVLKRRYLLRQKGYITPRYIRRLYCIK